MVAGRGVNAAYTPGAPFDLIKSIRKQVFTVNHLVYNPRSLAHLTADGGWVNEQYLHNLLSVRIEFTLRCN